MPNYTYLPLPYAKNSSQPIIFQETVHSLPKHLSRINILNRRIC